MPDATTLPTYGDPRLPEWWWANVTVLDDEWRWTGSLTADGYGRCRARSLVDSLGTDRAHRQLYVACIAPVPDDDHIDHLCHNRERATCLGRAACTHHACLTPLHLEAVPPAVNLARARGVEVGYCDHGHPLMGRNEQWYWCRGRRARGCRACRRERSRQSMARGRGVDPGPFAPRLET